MYWIRVAVCSVVAISVCTDNCLPDEKELHGPAFVSDEAAKHYHDLVLAFPPTSEIVTIRAEITSGKPDQELPPFMLPKESFEKVLATFGDSKIDTYPIFRLPELGCIVVTYTNGRTRRVCWYGGVKRAPLMFSVDGVRCISNKEKAKTLGISVVEEMHEKFRSDRSLDKNQNPRPRF